MISQNSNGINPGDLGKVYMIRVNFKLILGILFILSGLAIFVGLYWPVRDQRRYEIIFLSVIFFASGFSYIKQWYVNHGARIKVGDNGLIFIDKHSNATEIQWTRIGEIKQRILKYHFWLFMVPTKSFEYNIITTDGYCLNIDNRIKDHEGLVKIIKDNANSHIHTRLKDSLDRGEDIQFGKLQIGKSGIKKGNETLPWKDIKNIEAKEGNIYIFRKEKSVNWELVPVLEISNYAILIPMINEILKDQRSRE
jgi:elongation factor P hydroxylase